jgi:D-lactate dehydrogenase
MDEKRIAFFDAKPYDREFFDRVNSRYGFNIHYFESHLTVETAQLVKGFDAVCIFVNDIITKSVADILITNGIKIVALRCAGYNNVDFKAFYKYIHVVRVPAYSPYAVAEHAVALIMSLNRKVHKAYYRTRESNFTLNGLLGFDLHGKTVGVIGTGKIGKVACGIFKGFGMRVLAYDIYPDNEFARTTGIEYADLDTLYTTSDIISLYCPLTPQNLHMINKDSIAKMKDGVMIINTSRGKLINTADLIKGLKSRKIGAAGLDVYEEEGDYFFKDFSTEPISDDILARLLTFPNVLITSHQAFFTTEALDGIAGTTLENIRQFFEEGKLPNEICYQCINNECMRKKTGKCF